MASVLTFEELVGCDVSGVSFVRDYVEVLFDGPILRSLAPPTVREAGRIVSFPEPGSRDALCRLIDRTVESAEDRPEALVLIVRGPIELTIPKRSPGVGAEAAHFVPMRDGKCRVGAMSIWETMP